MVASRYLWRAFLSAMLVVALLASCTAGADFSDPPAPTATHVVEQRDPTPTRLPSAATQTAESSQVQYVIERVVLATEINDDGTPANEVSALSEEQQSIFLTVRVRELPAGTRFQAIWFENDQIIGQSDERIEQVSSDVQWVALPFRSIARLNPAAVHTVELVVNDRRIDSYAFRVGVGNASDVIAEATLALGTNEEGEPIKAGDIFDRFAPQIVLVARISNMVNPDGMIFNTFWTRDNLLLAQRAPDGGQPRLSSDPPDPADRRMTFTFVPEGNLVPGEYAVAVHLNGAEIVTYRFTVVPDDLPTVTPEPTERAAPTQTPVVSDVSLADLAITEKINEETGEPASERVNSVEAYPGERVPLYVALEMADLRVDDVVEFTVGINNSVIDRYRLPVAAFERGWLSTEVEFRAPDQPNDSVEYEIFVYLGGTRVSGIDVLIESTLDPPPTTPTPGGDDNDDDDDDND